jgi:hypothetical protein
MDKKKSARRSLNASLPAKVFFVILVGVFTKLFFSCTPPPPGDMYYNSIGIAGVDNSDRFLKRNTSVDTLYSGAVALNLTLKDSTFDYYAFNLNNALKSLSFTPAMALSFPSSFIPVNEVEKIKVTTLFDIDDEVRAGDDITPLILYETGRDFELYKNIDNAISDLNKTQSATSVSIFLVLKRPIDNTMAQFYVQVFLDNDNVLSTNTNIFTIIKQ